MINDYKSKGEWKVQLTTEINFISLKPGSDETRVMHTKSDNAEIRIGDDTSDVVRDFFKSLLQRYQENLQEKMRGSDFEFDGVNLLYYDFNKISLNRGGSYIESPKWIKNKFSTVNPKNNDYKCFQYAITVALNHDKINKHPQRVSKIKPFIDQYNWNDIDFPSTSKDWKKFELNNELIALNILYVPHKTGKIHLAYKSKHNLTREKQVVLLMITDGEKWHYLAVKRLSGLLRGVTSNNNGDFYCLNCFCSYRTKDKLELHKKVCENRDYCQVEMPNKDNNTIEFNQKDYGKAPFVIYADLECLLEKISTCYNNPEESSTTEVNKHTTSGYSIFTNCSFDERKNKLDYYRGNDCMKESCREKHAAKIINCNKKEVIPLTKEEESNYSKEPNCYICKKGFINYEDDYEKKYYKVKDYCYYTRKYKGAAHNNYSLKYKVQKEIPIVFHNGSTYDCHFIIKELAEELDGNFEWLGKNTEKYTAFSVRIKKEIRNKDKIIEMTYKIKFIDSYRFMSMSLSKLVDNLTERLHNNRCVDCESCVDYIKTKNEKLILK